MHDQNAVLKPSSEIFEGSSLNELKLNLDPRLPPNGQIRKKISLKTAEFTSYFFYEKFSRAYPWSQSPACTLGFFSPRKTVPKYSDLNKGVSRHVIFLLFKITYMN